MLRKGYRGNEPRYRSSLLDELLYSITRVIIVSLCGHNLNREFYHTATRAGYVTLQPREKLFAYLHSRTPVSLKAFGRTL